LTFLRAKKIKRLLLLLIAKAKNFGEILESILLFASFGFSGC
jgi:hypothetical protein